MATGGRAASKADDCYYFYYSTCQKGELCPFRHCAAALGREVVCRHWAQGACPAAPTCPFRHMRLDKARHATPCYWEAQPQGCLKPHCVFRHSKPRHFPDGAPGTRNVFRLEHKAPAAGTTATADDEDDQEIQVPAVGSSESQASPAQPSPGALKGLILPSVEMMEEEGQPKGRRVVVPKPKAQAKAAGQRRSAKDRLGAGAAGGGGAGSSSRPGRSNVRQRLGQRSGERKRSWSPAALLNERKRGVVNQTDAIRRKLLSGDEEREEDGSRPSKRRSHRWRTSPGPEEDEPSVEDADALMLSPPVSSDSNDRVAALLAKSSLSSSSGSGGPVKLRRPAAKTNEAAGETKTSGRRESEEYQAQVEALVGKDLADYYKEQGIKIDVAPK